MKTVWKGEWSAAVAKATTGYTVTVAKNYIWVATFAVMRDDSPRFRGNGVHTSRWGAECVHVREDAALANEDRADIPSSIDFAMWKDTLACCITACLQVCINAERDQAQEAKEAEERRRRDAEEAEAEEAAVEALRVRFGDTPEGRSAAYAERRRLKAALDAAQAAHDAAQAAHDELDALLKLADYKRSRRTDAA